jgi:hypothetical protein
MHAYLLVCKSAEHARRQAEMHGKELGAKIMEFPLAKIEDVRNLNNLIRLSVSEPTLIFSPDIHEATEEAMNAFLKNLEEPQENLYFALSAPSERAVISTVVSRCIIKKFVFHDDRNFDFAGKFLDGSIDTKFSMIDKIRDRDEAIAFLMDLSELIHTRIHDGVLPTETAPELMEAVIKTYGNLKKNGNVSLQLSNLTTRFVPIN